MEERNRRSRSCMCMRCKRALCYSSVQSLPSTMRVSTLKPFLTEALCKGRILTADAAASVITTDGAAGAAGRRGRGPLHQRQYAGHPSGFGTLFCATRRPIGVPGTRLTKSRKVMAVWNGATSPPVPISMTLYTEIGAKWDRSFECLANVPRKTSTASRWSMAGRLCRKSTVVPNVS